MAVAISSREKSKSGTVTRRIRSAERWTTGIIASAGDEKRTRAFCPRSAREQSKGGQNCENHDNQPDQINDVVHRKPPEDRRSIRSSVCRFLLTSLLSMTRVQRGTALKDWALP